MDSGVKPLRRRACDGNQPGIIPAVHDAFLYQLLDITFAGNNIGQVQLCKLDLTGRIGIFQLLTTQSYSGR